MDPAPHLMAPQERKACSETNGDESGHVVYRHRQRLPDFPLWLLLHSSCTFWSCGNSTLGFEVSGGTSVHPSIPAMCLSYASSLWYRSAPLHIHMVNLMRAISHWDVAKVIAVSASSGSERMSTEGTGVSN